MSHKLRKLSLASATGFCLGAAALAWLLAAPAAAVPQRESAGTLRVFVLAGQSNMEGQAVVDLAGADYNGGRGTLLQLMQNAEFAARFGHWSMQAGRWPTREDVFVRYRTAGGAVKRGRLGVGFTAYADEHHFGPELEFGHVLGEHFAEPVLLIKTAWGGKSLHRDFRPPSAGSDGGTSYQAMIQEVDEALAAIAVEFPELAAYEPWLAGFVWYQGWNDGAGPQEAVREYGANLAHLIEGVRRDLAREDLAFVVGELTGPWVNAPAEWEALRLAQASAARRSELLGVRFVETRAFVRAAQDSPNPTHGHHEFGNAETYLLVGQALGRGMLELLLDQPPAQRTTRWVQGWTVRVHERLVREQAVATNQALELLERQLAEVRRVLPQGAQSKLREVELWFSPPYPGCEPTAEYHAHPAWPRENGRDPALGRQIEFTNIAVFPQEYRRMPNFVLHELAHAYHDRVLGFDHPQVKQAFTAAVSSGAYEEVERWNGTAEGSTRERAYALTNPMEYFAECSEAFFSRNDFYPFTRAELERHDPLMAQLLAELWALAPQPGK